MAQLFGVLVSDPDHLRCQLHRLGGRTHLGEGTEALGLGYFADGDVLFSKRPGPLADDDLARLTGVRSPALIAAAQGPGFVFEEDATDPFRFRRWLFGEYRDRDVPILTLVSLLAGVALVLALMAINGAIALVVAARLAVPGAAWPTAGLIGDLSTALPLFDLWPFRYATSFELKPGCEPSYPGDPGFRACHEDVGDFPEVDLPLKTIYTRIVSAFGAGLVGIL